jgi:hypothetical protein
VDVITGFQPSHGSQGSRLPSDSAGFRFSATMSPAEGRSPNDTLTPRVWLRIDPDLQIDVGTEIS